MMAVSELKSKCLEHIPEVMTYLGMFVVLLALYFAFYNEFTTTIQLLSVWGGLEFIGHKFVYQWLGVKQNKHTYFLQQASDIAIAGFVLPTIIALYFETEVFSQLFYSITFFGFAVFYRNVRNMIQHSGKEHEAKYGKFCKHISAPVYAAYILLPMIMQISEMSPAVSPTTDTIVMLLAMSAFTLLALPTYALSACHKQCRWLCVGAIIWFVLLIVFGHYSLGMIWFGIVISHAVSIPFAIKQYCAAQSKPHKKS